MAISFDDLIPKRTGLSFDDLIPAKPTSRFAGREQRRNTLAGQAPVVDNEIDWTATGQAAIGQGEKMFGGLMNWAGVSADSIGQQLGISDATRFAGQLLSNPTMEQAPDAVPQALQEIGTDVRDAGEFRLQQAQPDLIQQPDSFLADPVTAGKYVLQQGIVSGAPTAVGLGLGAVGAPTAGLGLMGALVGGDKFSETLAETGDVGRAHEAALYAAGAETIPEMIPMALLGKRAAQMFGDDVAGYVGKLAEESPGLKWALTAGAEGGSEVLTETANIAYEAIREGKDISGEEVWKRLRDAGAVGAAMGGAVAAPVYAGDKFTNASGGLLGGQFTDSSGELLPSVSGRRPMTKAEKDVASGFELGDSIIQAATEKAGLMAPPVSPQPAPQNEWVSTTPQARSALDAAVRQPESELDDLLAPQVPVEPLNTRLPEYTPPQAQTPEPVTAIAAPATATAVDQRAPVDYRQRLAELRRLGESRAPEQQSEYVRLLEEDRVTAKVGGQPVLGVRNFTQYQDLASDGVLPQYTLISDADNFKSINDEFGHDLGDEVIRAIGVAMRDAGAEIGAQSFHRSGDEFLSAADDPQALAEVGRKVNEALAGKAVELIRPDGSVVRKVGVQLSFGVGRNETDAEVQLKRDKDARRDAGLRTERREAPRIPDGMDAAGAVANPAGSTVAGQGSGGRSVAQSGFEVADDPGARTQDRRSLGETAPPAAAQETQADTETEAPQVSSGRGTTAAMATDDVAGTKLARAAGDETQREPPIKDGHSRFYHGGGDGLTEIIGGSGPGNIFGGVFASQRRESAASHGSGAVYRIDIPNDRVLSQSQLDYEIDSDTADQALRDSMPWLDEDDIDIARTAVIEDRAERVDDDDLTRVFREDSAGEASWEAQRIRGLVARRLGFDAVEMRDEHGTSYLILPGADIQPVTDISAPGSSGANRNADPTPSTDGVSASEPQQFLRATGRPRVSRPVIERSVRRVSANWRNAPQIVIIDSMEQAPEDVRAEDAKQRRGGAQGDPSGFWHDGKVYIVASGQDSSASVARTVLHEVLGHAGLTGAFGEGMGYVLDRIAATRADQVRQKARDYGLDPNNAKDMRTAAEEVLAEMAESDPSDTFVRRAIAIVKKVLRDLGLMNANEISDEEITREYLRPARRFIERGERVATSKAEPAMKRGEADERDLVAIHNTTARKLKHAMRMGGFAVPSIAVMKKDQSLTGFGDITLIGDSQLVDPKRGAKAFGADVYSPRYPQVTLEFTKNMRERGNRMLQEGMDATGVEYIEWESISDGESLGTQAPFLWKFLRDNAIEPNVVTVQPPDIPQRLMQFVDSGMDMFDLARDADFIEAVSKPLRKELGSDERLMMNIVRGEARRIEDYRRAVRESGKPDRMATYNALKAQIRDADLEERLEQAASDFIGALGPNEKLFQGHTNAGYRKYIPHTLANVVKILKKDMRGGENFNYGVGSLRAKFTPQFRSIEQMRKEKGRLVSPEDFARVKREVGDELESIASALAPHYTYDANRFGYQDQVTSAFSDAATQGLPRALSEYGFKDVPDDVQRQAATFLNKLRNLPTEYFEVNQPRAVELMEFRAAVVPAETDAETMSILRRAGLEVTEYPRGNDAARQAAVQSAAEKEGVLFQRRKAGDTIDVDGTPRPRTNSNGKPIAQTDEALRNFWRWFGDSKVVDDQRRPLVVYHGTGKSFDEFRQGAGKGAGGRSARLGFFFTDSAEVASQYAEETPEFEKTRGAERAMRLEMRGKFDEADAINREIESPEFTGGMSPAVVPVYLSIQEPGVTDFGGRSYDADQDNLTELINVAKGRGQDGVIFRSLDDSVRDGPPPADHFVIFESTQAKSATGNQGTFDPENPDIRFQRRMTKGRGVETVGQYWQRELYDNWIDEFDSLARAERETVGGSSLDTRKKAASVSDDVAARRAENLRHGRYQQKLREADREIFEPMAQAVGRVGATMEEFADYLWWRHAPERDAALRAKHKGSPAADALAGIDPKDAAANIAALPADKRKAFEDAAKSIDQLRDRTLTLLESSGQISTDTADALRNQYQFYVPLRGMPESMDDPNLDNMSRTYGVGRGLGVKQNPIGKKALGRKSKPQNIVEEMKRDLQRALVGAEKQRVLSRVINLMMQNPQIGRIDPVEYVKQEVNGLIQYVPKNVTENTVTFLHQGKPVRLKLADPRLEAAMLNLNEPVNEFLRKAGKVTRWLSAVKTSLSPYFMLINPVRDAAFASMGIGAEEGGRALAQFAKWYPQAWTALYRDERGKPKSKPIDRYAGEFAKAGGKTGYTLVNDINEISKDLGRIFALYQKNAGAKGLAKRLWIRAGDMIEAGNNIAENSARLAAFAAKRDQGASIEEAATYAKNITVNFNVKGKHGKVMNNAYMFFNAAVQGSRRTVQLMGNPKFAATMVGLAAASYAIALKQLYDAGDDEDGESKYLKLIGEFDANRSIPVQTGDDTYASIPIPYGPNMFSYLGWKLAVMQYQADRGRSKSIAANAGDILLNMSNSMSPIQVERGFYAMVPEAVRVPVQAAANIDDFGNPISYAEKFKGSDDTSPAYRDADYKTGELFVLMSQFANAATGGDEYEAGFVNVAPEKIRYLFQQGLGGLYRLANESGELIQQVMDDAPVEPRDVPLANVYSRSRDLSFQQSQTFYENRAEVTNRRRIYREALEAGDDRKVEEMLDENPWLDGSELNGNSKAGRKAQQGTPVGALRDAEKSIRALRDERKAAYTGTGDYEGVPRPERMKRVREIDREIATAQREFNASMNDMPAPRPLPVAQ